jgi:hypothetical protein
VYYIFFTIHKQLSHIWIRQVAKSDTANCDALVDLFAYIEIVLKRLKIHPEVPVTPGVTQILVKTMVELVAVCALATKEVKEGLLGGSTLPMNGLLM